MTKKYKTVTQNLNEISVHQAYQANIKYNAEQIAAKCKEDANTRHDLSDDFKKHLLSQPVGRNCEIVYYPVYFYNTSTDLSWTTTSTRNSDVYEGGQYYNVTTTTTTSHSKTNLKGTSDMKVKTSHNELRISEIDLAQTAQISNYKSKSIPVYESGLFYTNEENRQNAIEAGRKAANAKRNQSSYTRWSAYLILVPVARYVFEYEGKECLFEMNLHNGEVVTAYKQKGLNVFLRAFVRVIRGLYSFTGIFLPIIVTVYGFMFRQLITDSIFEMVLSFAGMAAAVIIGFVGWGAFAVTRSFTYEKATSLRRPFDYIKLFIAPHIVAAIVLVITSGCNNALFM